MASNDKAKDGEKLGGKKFDKEMRKLHVELVKLQEWVKSTGTKICIVFCPSSKHLGQLAARSKGGSGASVE